MENGLRILLVEDEPKIAQSLADQLHKNRYEVEIAYDGLMAEKLFIQNLYDLIILDINLPLKNGLQLCKMFREKRSNVPIIMLTALGEIQDKLEAFELGAD